MKNNKDLKMVEAKLAIIKAKSESKARFEDDEKEDFKQGLITVCEKLSLMLNDASIVEDMKERLGSGTRKQMVLIKKVIKELQEYIKAIKGILN